MDAVLHYAASGGQLKVLQWLDEQGVPIRHVANTAGLYGFWEIVQWARGKGDKIECPDVCILAAADGRRDIQEAAKEDGLQLPRFDSVRAIAAAAAAGHLELVQWMREKGCRWDTKLCTAAAGGGHLKLLQWVRKQNCRCPWDASTCSAAAGGNHLEVLKWARKKGCAWGPETCRAAAREGHLEVLQWAWDHGCEVSVSTCAAAAKHGRFEVLKWAWENGLCWDGTTCTAAAKGGHLEILQWVREQGCPYEPNDREGPGARLFAIAMGHQQVVDWIQEEGKYPEGEFPRDLIAIKPGADAFEIVMDHWGVWDSEDEGEVDEEDEAERYAVRAMEMEDMPESDGPEGGESSGSEEGGLDGAG